MGLREGTFLVSDCGAEVVYVRPCPDEPTLSPTCACGAEFHEQPAGAGEDPTGRAP